MSRGSLSATILSANPLMGYSPAELQFKTLTPLSSNDSNKRRTEGLLTRDSVVNDGSLYIAYSDRQAFDATPMGQLSMLLWMKGARNGGDTAGDLGGFDYMDVQTGWPVFTSTPTIIPGFGSGATVWYIPIAQGPHNYAKMQFAIDPAAMSANQPTSTTSPATLPALPPGPGGAVAAKPTVLVEFSVNESGDGWWFARTPAASAAMKEGNPHPGISIINPGAWEQVSQGESPKEALGVEDYVAKGWKGLGQRILAWQGNVQAPANEEITQALALAEAGDMASMQALAAINVRPPANYQANGGIGGFFHELGL